MNFRARLEKLEQPNKPTRAEPPPLAREVRRRLEALPYEKRHLILDKLRERLS